MKKVLLLLLVVVAMGAGVAWGGVTVTAASPFKSPQPPPKQVIKYTVKGDNAYADFYSSAGCISDYITVWAGESVTKDGPGKPAANSVVGIQISGYDSCAGQSFFGYGYANLSPDAFNVQGPLKSATLNAVVQLCCDLNGASFPATINLTWTGTGAISQNKTSYTSKSPTCKSSYSSQGDGRSAMITGSVTVMGAQLTPQPGSYAFIGSSKEASMLIGCN